MNTSAAPIRARRCAGCLTAGLAVLALTACNAEEPAAGPDPSGSAAAQLVTGSSSPEMTLQQATAAAEAASCAGCVSPTLDQGLAEESARRGLVELVVSPADDAAAVELWGYSDQGWQPLTGYQNDVPMPNRLPSNIWICTDDEATVVRSGPGEDYPVVTPVDDVTPVRATFLRLTEPQTTAADGSLADGTGWFEVSGEEVAGWVATDRVDRLGACTMWP